MKDFCDTIYVCLKKLIPQRIANRFFLIADVLMSCSVRVMLAQDIGKSKPISPCESTAFKIKADAFVAIIKVLTKFGNCQIVGDLSYFKKVGIVMRLATADKHLNISAKFL